MKLPNPPVTVEGDTIVREGKRISKGDAVRANGVHAIFAGLTTDNRGSVYARCVVDGRTRVLNVSKVRR